MAERDCDRWIAVVGFGCRYPGVDRPDQLWEVLSQARDTTSEVPAERYDAAALHATEPTPGKLLSRRAGFLADPGGFDAAFFGLSAEDADYLDPQQRMLMMCTWEALEDAGIAPQRIAGSRVGVFVGHMHSDYAERQYRRGLDSLKATTVKNYRSLLSGRLSHTFDLRGPSVSLDTACSSSLVALHLAGQSLRTGESTLALAAGVNLKLLPDEDVLFSQVRMVAADGRSKFGDASADGFCPGDGVGVVALKRLDQALADGDRIRAVILGSAVSNDGASSGAVLRPSLEGQVQTLRWAYENAGVDPAEVDFVEAHGTGTPLIDPLEMAAFGEVFGPGRPVDRPLLVGSVKSNIGHSEGASGIAALIKVVLCMENRQIPASLHFRNPNPKIPWDQLNLVIPTQLRPLPYHGRPMVAGISGQGLSAVNAHVVVGEAPASPASEAVQTRPAGTYETFAISARTPVALADLARAFIDHLQATDARTKQSLHDICYSAAVRRPHHDCRFALAVDSREALVTGLREFLDSGQLADPTVPAPLRELIDRYRRGEQVDWTDTFGDHTRFVPLPTYPWQLTRHWQD